MRIGKWDTLGGSLAIAGTIAFVLGLLWAAVPAKAADKGAPNFLELPGATPKSPWTGFGIGVYGSALNGELDLSPVNVGSNGMEAGGNLNYSVALGAFVVSAGFDYGRVFGDLSTIGVDGAMSIYGTAGVLVSANTQIYTLLARSRLDTTLGNVDGWQLGGGIQTKLPTAPLFLRLEYRHGTYDLSDVGLKGVDATMDVVRLGLDLKFN